MAGVKQSNKVTSDSGLSDVKTHLKKPKNWYIDRYMIVSVQRNLFFILSIVSTLVVLVCLLTIKSINEKRQLEPYIVEINKTTGIATAVVSDTLKQYTAQNIIQEYFVVNYIMSREGYDPSTYVRDYFDYIRVMSDPAIYEAFRKTIDASNPDSPINKIANTGIIKVTLKTVLPLSDNRMEIRISRKQIINNNITEEKLFLVSVEYNFANLELSATERYINPLGFHVTKYTKTEEKIIDALAEN